MTWRNRIKWSLLAIAAIILLITLTLGLWVRLRTEMATRELVETLSNGKYGLKAKKIRVDPFRMRATAEKIYIYPIHSGTTNSEFELKADSLSLELSEIIRLLLRNQLHVTSFSIINPSLQLRVYEKGNDQKKAPIPLHHQVALIQDIFFKVLESLKVNQFKLKNGSIAYYPELSVSEGRYFLKNINLDINNLHLLEKFTSGNRQNKASVHLELLNPAIEYPDSTIKIALQRFDWNTKYRRVTITGLGIHKSIVSGNDSSGFQLRDISLDTLNWNKLLNYGIVEIGELSAGKGYFSSNAFRFKKRNKDSLIIEKNGNILDVIGPIHVKKLSIHEIEFTGNTHSKGRKETINISGDELTINKLVVDKDLPNKIQLENLNLKVKAYLETDSTKSFRSGFGEINIQNNNLFLKDYYLHSISTNRTGENKIDVKELELKDLSIGDLLNGKLKARELVLANPTVRLLLPAGKKKGNGLDWQRLRSKINKTLDIGLIRINNANVLINQENRITPLVKSDSFYAIIASRNVLRSHSLEELFAADNSFSMPKMAIRLPNITIDLEEAAYSNNTLSAASAKGETKNGNLRFRLNKLNAVDVNMANIINKQDSGLLRILNIGNGEVFITIPDTKPETVKNPPSQLVRSIITGPIKFNVSAGSWKLNTTMDSINIDYLRKEGKDWLWNEYFLMGSNLSIQHPEISGKVGSFTIGDKQNNLIQRSHFEVDRPAFKLIADIPDMEIRQKIQSTNKITEAIESLTLGNAQLDVILKYSDPNQQIKKNTGTTSIPAISLINPKITISKEQADSLRKIASANGGQVIIDPITITENVVSLDGVRLDLKNIKTQQEKYMLHVPELKLYTEKLKISKGDPIQTKIKALEIQDGQFIWNDAINQLSAKGISAKIDKPFWFNSTTDSLKKLLTTLPHLTFNTDEFFQEKSGRQLKAYQLTVSSDKKQITFDSLHWIGTISRDSFFKASKVQKDFINIHTGKGVLSGYELIDRDNDTVWAINHLSLFDMNSIIERDKRYPVDNVSFRPLMTGMLQKIPIQFAMERIFLGNASVRYNEINEKNGKEGSIWFSDITAVIKNIRNIDINEHDSLTLIAHTKLMDRGNLQLAFRESYLDSLRGFYMLARMGRMELNALSPLLYPLFNIKIDRGHVDSMWLRVKANDFLAYGKMEMDYRKLKLSLLNEDGKKKGFSSFLINTVLRSNNDKTGMVYRERLRNKSMFNYWGKIAMSGLLTNMGVQKNKKQVKKYNKEMKSLNLPPDLLEE